MRDANRSALEQTSSSPERLRIRVVLMPIRSTVPDLSPTVTELPTTNGWSSTIASEANRSPRMFWAAKAIAMPPMPRPATRAVTSNPRLLRISRNAIDQTTTRANSWMRSNALAIARFLPAFLPAYQPIQPTTT